MMGPRGHIGLPLPAALGYGPHRLHDKPPLAT